MGSVFEGNISCLKNSPNRFPQNINDIIKRDGGKSTLKSAVAKNGEVYVFSEKDGKTLYLNSRYNPSKEANSLAEEVLLSTDINAVAVVGIGTSHLIRCLLKLRKDITILAIEPSEEDFSRLLEDVDLRDILSDNRVVFFVGDEAYSEIETYLSITNFRGMKVISSRGYVSLYPDYAKAMQQHILSIVERKNINFNTLFKFDRLWARNIMSNIDIIPFCFGINKFFGVFENIPIVVISAGPSLEKNIETLVAMRDKAIFIAVDTALKPLAYHGIKPDFVLAVDPQEKNAKYFRGVDTEDIILICESSIHNEIIRNYKGPVYFVDSIFPLAQYVMRFLGERGEVNMGGSVSTTAFEFARLCLGSPIIMVGLDLSFPSHHTHIRGSYHEENFFTQINKLDTYESRIYKVLASGKLTPSKNIYGDRVYTDSRFAMYKEWYQKQCRKGVKVYNATEGGIDIEGMENIKLSTLASSLNIIDIDLSVYKSGYITDEKNIFAIAESLSSDFAKIKEEISDIKESCEEALRLCGYMERDIKRGKSVDKFLSSLSIIDEKILSLGEAKHFIGITMQKAIRYITDGYEIDTDEDGHEALINSRYLYKTMKDSAEFNLRLLEMGLVKIKKLCL